MAETSFLLKKFEMTADLYVLYSQATRLPYVECDEETFEDCILMFSDQNEVQKCAKKYTEKKILLAAGQVPGKNIKNFLASMHCLGINAIRYIDGDTVIKEELSNMITPPDLEAMRNEKIPRVNPEMQLTAMYFMQELRRPIERTLEEKKNIKELEEEMAVNMMRSRWIVCADITDVTDDMSREEAGKKMKLPYVKTKDGSVFQPIFSDFAECQKFNQGNTGAKLRLLPITYDEIKKYIIREAKGVCINPKGFNLFLTTEQLDKMKEQYGE
ncbi:MAG: SseB family protein [Lachnospiraceae bacterium]|nr:SseB family protein [Lachnospiraceae bacterium]